MQVYFFPQRDSWRRIGLSAVQLQAILERIAAGSETAELVVAVHLLHRTAWSGGTAYVRQWHHPAAFYARRGKWCLRGEWERPADLPPRFKLIRLLLADDRAVYPLTIVDRYGWQHRFESFGDHLAFFFRPRTASLSPISSRFASGRGRTQRQRLGGGALLRTWFCRNQLSSAAAPAQEKVAFRSDLLAGAQSGRFFTRGPGQPALAPGRCTARAGGSIALPQSGGVYRRKNVPF